MGRIPLEESGDGYSWWAGEVRHPTGAAFGAGKDMLDRKHVRCVVGRRKTVLAAIAGATGDGVPRAG
jgi:hypothetical protein